MRSFVIILLSFIAGDGISQAERKFIRQGNRDYDEKNYQQAEIGFRKALEKAPGSVPADFNLGNALYRQKQYEPAAGKYAELAQKEKEKGTLSRYYYNLGNALFESKKYTESIGAYKNALRANPSDTDAKHNLQLALRMLNDQNNRKNQEQKGDQDQQEQGKNEQNNNREQGNNKEQKPEQGQGQEDKQEQQQPQSNKDQQSRGQISPEDAERILRALENDEKNVLKRVQEQKKKVQKPPVDKNW
jgi:Ca-activated chloride channel family protein